MNRCFPWNRTQKLRDFLKPESRVLALSALDAAFLLELGHPAAQVFRGEIGESEGFDLVTAFFAPYDRKEVYRLLKPGGYFLTEQLGGETAAQLFAALGISRILPEDFNLENESERFLQDGFTLNFRDQFFAPVDFAGAEDIQQYISETPEIFGALSGEDAGALRRNAERLFAGHSPAGSPIRDFEHRFILIARKRKA